jgi:hypothetical protein
VDLQFILYLFLILVLIYKTGCFGLVRATHISPILFCVLFLLKALAVPAFYLVYKKAYGGLEGFDAGKFFNDARIINEYSHQDFIGYLKLLFGLQNDAPGSDIYTECLKYTANWDNGSQVDFFYNDNRIVIRLHSLFHFISGSYFVHALLNCFLSFVGIVYLFKAFKDLFPNKEILFLLILCFFPSLWFYTGAVLKEGLALFTMGCLAYQLKQLAFNPKKLGDYISLFFLLCLATLLKPYLLIPSAFSFFIYFIVQKLNSKHKVIYFLSLLVVLLISVNTATVVLKGKSLVTIATNHQRVFADAAKGGIFLLDDSKFVRLDYDYTLTKKLPGADSLFSIKQDVPYVYWEHQHQQDTLYNRGNTDTLAIYKLVYDVPKSGSNILMTADAGFLKQVGGYFYYALFHPLFINAKGALQWMASFENLLLVISFVIITIGLIRNKKDAFPVVLFLCFALGLCLLIGATTPNSGAIFRYRSPVVIFILASALYYYKPQKTSA